MKNSPKKPSKSGVIKTKKGWYQEQSEKHFDQFVDDLNAWIGNHVFYDHRPINTGCIPINIGIIKSKRKRK